MSLLNTMGAFCAVDHAAERAAFEAAMTARIQEEGYKMSDLLFELYTCQKRLAIIEDALAPKKKRK